MERDTRYMRALQTLHMCCIASLVLACLVHTALPYSTGVTNTGNVCYDGLPIDLPTHVHTGSAGSAQGAYSLVFYERNTKNVVQGFSRDSQYDGGSMIGIFIMPLGSSGTFVRLASESTFKAKLMTECSSTIAGITHQNAASVSTLRAIWQSPSEGTIASIRTTVTTGALGTGSTFVFLTNLPALSNDSKLANLSFSELYPLRPVFTPTVTSYSAAVPNHLANITFSILPSSASISQVLVNGYAIDTAVELSVGSNLVFVTVTAEDPGVSTTYQVVVVRSSPDPILSSMEPQIMLFGEQNIVSFTGAGLNGLVFLQLVEASNSSCRSSSIAVDVLFSLTQNVDGSSATIAVAASDAIRPKAALLSNEFDLQTCFWYCPPHLSEPACFANTTNLQELKLNGSTGPQVFVRPRPFIAEIPLDELTQLPARTSTLSVDGAGFSPAHAFAAVTLQFETSLGKHVGYTLLSSNRTQISVHLLLNFTVTGVLYATATVDAISSGRAPVAFVLAPPTIISTSSSAISKEYPYLTIRGTGFTSSVSDVSVDLYTSNNAVYERRLDLAATVIAVQDGRIDCMIKGLPAQTSGILYVAVSIKGVLSDVAAVATIQSVIARRFVAVLTPVIASALTNGSSSSVPLSLLVVASLPPAASSINSNVTLVLRYIMLSPEGQVISTQFVDRSTGTRYGMLYRPTLSGDRFVGTSSWPVSNDARLAVLLAPNLDLVVTMQTNIGLIVLTGSLFQLDGDIGQFLDESTMFSILSVGKSNFPSDALSAYSSDASTSIAPVLGLFKLNTTTSELVSLVVAPKQAGASPSAPYIISTATSLQLIAEPYSNMSLFSAVCSTEAPTVSTAPSFCGSSLAIRSAGLQPQVFVLSEEQLKQLTSSPYSLWQVCSTWKDTARSTMLSATCARMSIFPRWIRSSNHLLSTTFSDVQGYLSSTGRLQVEVEFAPLLVSVLPARATLTIGGLELASSSIHGSSTVRVGTQLSQGDASQLLNPASSSFMVVNGLFGSSALSTTSLVALEHSTDTGRGNWNVAALTASFSQFPSIPVSNLSFSGSLLFVLPSTTSFAFKLSVVHPASSGFWTSDEIQLNLEGFGLLILAYSTYSASNIDSVTVLEVFQGELTLSNAAYATLMALLAAEDIGLQISLLSSSASNPILVSKVRRVAPGTPTHVVVRRDMFSSAQAVYYKNGQVIQGVTVSGLATIDLIPASNDAVLTVAFVSMSTASSYLGLQSMTLSAFGGSIEFLNDGSTASSQSELLVHQEFAFKQILVRKSSTVGWHAAMASLRTLVTITGAAQLGIASPLILAWRASSWQAGSMLASDFTQPSSGVLTMCGDINGTLQAHAQVVIQASTLAISGEPNSVELCSALANDSNSHRFLIADVVLATSTCNNNQSGLLLASSTPNLVVTRVGDLQTLTQTMKQPIASTGFVDSAVLQSPSSVIGLSFAGSAGTGSGSLFWGGPLIRYDLTEHMPMSVLSQPSNIFNMIATARLQDVCLSLSGSRLYAVGSVKVLFDSVQNTLRYVVKVDLATSEAADTVHSQSVGVSGSLVDGSSSSESSILQQIMFAGSSASGAFVFSSLSEGQRQLRAFARGELQLQLRLQLSSNSSSAPTTTCLLVAILNSDPLFASVRGNSQTLIVSEHATVGSELLQRDLGKASTFTLSPPTFELDSQSLLFSALRVDSDTGIVSIAANLSPFAGEVFIVTIVSRDAKSGRRDTFELEVIICMEQRSPTLQVSTQNITVLESSPLGATLATILIHDDNAAPGAINCGGVADALSMSFTRLSLREQFSLEQTGASSWAVRLAKPLDRETHSQFEIEVQAVDTTGLSVLGAVTLLVGDVNDNRPLFRVDEACSSVPTCDSSLAPHVCDSSTACLATLDACSTNSGNASEDSCTNYTKFRLCVEQVLASASVCPLPLHTTLLLHMLGNNAYQNASCAQHSTVCGLECDQSIDSASCLVNRVSLNESVFVNSPLFQVQATDADVGANGAVHYSIVRNYTCTDLASGDFCLRGSLIEPDLSHSIFQINSSTGMVSITSPLNFELQSVHHIFVRATDDGAVSQSTTMRIDVTVLNVGFELTLSSSNLHPCTAPSNSCLGREKLSLQLGSNAEEDVGSTLYYFECSMVVVAGSVAPAPVWSFCNQSDVALSLSPLNTALFLGATTFTWDPSTEGTYQFSARAKYINGTTTAAPLLQLTVSIVLQPPTLQAMRVQGAIGPPTAPIVTRGTVDVQLTIVPSASSDVRLPLTVLYQIASNGGWQVATATNGSALEQLAVSTLTNVTARVSNLADGSYSLCFKVVDTLDNFDVSVSLRCVTITVDAVPAAAYLSLLVPADIVTEATSQLAVYYVDDLSATLAGTLDSKVAAIVSCDSSGAVAKGSSPSHYRCARMDKLAEGHHKLVVSVVDTLARPTVALEYAWKVDLSPPTLRIASPLSPLSVVASAWTYSLVSDEYLSALYCKVRKYQISSLATCCASTIIDEQGCAATCMSGQDLPASCSDASGGQSFVSKYQSCADSLISSASTQRTLLYESILAPCSHSGQLQDLLEHAEPDSFMEYELTAVGVDMLGHGTAAVISVNSSSTFSSATNVVTLSKLVLPSSYVLLNNAGSQESGSSVATAVSSSCSTGSAQGDTLIAFAILPWFLICGIIVYVFVRREELSAGYTSVFSSNQSNHGRTQAPKLAGGADVTFASSTPLHQLLSDPQVAQQRGYVDIAPPRDREQIEGPIHLTLVPIQRQQEADATSKPSPAPHLNDQMPVADDAASEMDEFQAVARNLLQSGQTTATLYRNPSERRSQVAADIDAEAYMLDPDFLNDIAPMVGTEPEFMLDGQPTHNAHAVDRNQSDNDDEAWF